MPTNALDLAVVHVADYLDRIAKLNARYRAGEMRVNVPEALRDASQPLDALVERHFPASHAAFKAAAQSLFLALPVAFEPSMAVGPYLSVIDRDPSGEPYRFLDMGALIATHAFGENDPD